jgi:hypothetical protein
MEIDFSNQIASSRSNRSPVQPPTNPEEKEQLEEKDDKKLITSEADSIQYSKKIIEALENKVKEHNGEHDKKVSLGQLKKVYRRGAASFGQSRHPEKNKGQWAMARANMFLRMVAGEKVKDSYKKSDEGVARVEDIDFSSYLYPDEQDFAQAKADVLEYDIDLYDFNPEELYLDDESEALGFIVEI